MSHIYPHIIEEIEHWPINIFAQHRKAFIAELNQIVFNQIDVKYNGRFEDVLAKTIYLEKQRVKVSPWKVDPSDDTTYWDSLETEIAESENRSDKQEALASIMKRVINRYNEEIVGGFKKNTFKFARKFLTMLFRIIFLPFKDKSGWFWGSRKSLLERIHVDGYIDETRALFGKGTVVVVPTHFSNLDSIMIGYVMDMAAGLPAFTYGAGLNLYDAEIPAYFMNRLGAYRVDRRKKNPIYLECLTSMASYSTIKGVNNIFFPGGTRSRSGAMEEKLKLGLLGSVIDAQRELIANDKDHKIYVVPVVMGYHFTFEAKSLIEQFLRAQGAEKYTKSKENRVGGFTFGFLKKFFSQQSEFYLTFGEPLDVLGNFVNEEGESIDKNCRPIELKDYFLLDGELNENNQRESVYARLLGGKVLENYFRNNLILTSHLCAYVAYQIWQSDLDRPNLFQVMKMTSDNFKLDIERYKRVLHLFIEHLKLMHSKKEVRLHNRIYAHTDEVIADGLRYLGVYHTQKTLYISSDKVLTQNVRLLYYYHNRLDGYRFEEVIDDIVDKIQNES